MPSTTIELRAKDKTKEAFSSVSKSMKGMKDSLGGLKGALGALIGAAGIGAMVSELRDVADQLGKVSARLGVNAKDLQVFQAAAQKSGMDVNQFNIALQRFTRRTAEAAMGTGEAKGALAEMGLQLTDNDGVLRSNTDLMKDVALVMGTDLFTQADKVRIAFKLFDSEGVKMLNMLQSGLPFIEGAGRELEKVSAIIQDDTIAASEQLGDRLDLLSKGFMNKLSPAIEIANAALTPYVKEAELAGLPLDKMREKLQEQISLLKKQKDELLASKNSFSLFGVEVDMSMGVIDKNAQVMQDEINRLKEVTVEVGKQIEADKKLSDSKLEVMKANREKNAELSDTEALKKATEEEQAWLDEMEIEYSIKQRNYEAMQAQKLEAMAEADREYLEQWKEIQKEIEFEAELNYQQHLKREEEKKEKQFEDNMAYLAEEQNKLMLENQAYEQSMAEKKRIAEEDAKNQKKLDQQNLKSSLQTIEALSSGVKDGSIEMFRLWQAAAIANTTISTYEAATKALTVPPPPVGMALAGVITALGMANVAKIASTNYTGKKAGGDVTAGHPYIVGEAGPELFQPGRTGSIVPNKNLSKPTVVNVNISAIDSQSIDELLTQRKGLLVSLINQSLARSTRAPI